MKCSYTCEHLLRYSIRVTYVDTRIHTLSDHAKLLWQRIPSEVKQSNGELGELWEIGKRLWRRDFAGIYELAKNPSWPPHVAPIVSNLVGKKVLGIHNIV